MLRIIQNSHASGAKSYYSTADYYTDGQELTGQWRGIGAAKLGLAGEIQREDWDALCDNRNPMDGGTLTLRQKENRRVGFDFNFHVPKSVSLLYGLTGDERIVEAFRACVDETMQDIESEMQTRVRRSGKNEDRTTATMLWGEFIHTTARPVDGVPDPHLHAHCFVFNTTFDDHEQRWKAGQFAGIKRDAPYFEALFHSRFAQALQRIGLPVERTRTGWELAGFSKSTLEKFSRRTALIEEQARIGSITDEREKDALGAKTRQRKAKQLTMPELRREWQSRLTDDERETVDTLSTTAQRDRILNSKSAAAEGLAYAIAHCFERNAVVPERKLLAEAIKRSVGTATAETVLAARGDASLIAATRNGQRMVTTPEVLAEERQMIDFARKGRGACHRLGTASHNFKRDWLNAGQRKAVLHVLNSPDRVMMVRGAAGTGKTTMMMETVEAMESNGYNVHVFAPSAEASRGVLRAEGFKNAETVARLLIDPELQASVQNGVIWVDEAGLLGSRPMAQLFALADKQNARVVLSGDKFQHGSVDRGAVLRLLENDAGIRSADIREIQRQKGRYKQAVKALSEGHTYDGFRQLDALGWIREVDGPDRYKVLAQDYIDAIAAKKSALVISPTHSEGERIAAEIRTQLKSRGRIGRDEREFQTLHNLNLTEGQRTDRANYSKGDILVYHQNATGHCKNDRLTVGTDVLSLDQAARFQAFKPTALKLAPGDIIRITRNGKTLDGAHRLTNGARYAVRRFDADGNIILDNGWTVAKDYGHFTQGFVVTSHASQSATVDRVIIGQASESFGASSQEQLYVSVSRGRESATIYTDDKAALLDAAIQVDERVTATEFLSAGISRGLNPVSDRTGDADRLQPQSAQRPQPEEEFAHER